MKPDIEFQHCGDGPPGTGSWIVTVKQRLLLVPYRWGPTIPIGTIAETDGATDLWMYFVPTEARNATRERFARCAAKILADPETHRLLALAREAYEAEEQSTGSFMVYTVGTLGSWSRWHTMQRASHHAHKWLVANKQPGNRAEIYRAWTGAGPTPSHAPWGQAFSALEVNEHGAVVMARLTLHHAPPTKKRQREKKNSE